MIGDIYVDVFRIVALSSFLAWLAWPRVQGLVDALLGDEADTTA